MKQTEELELFLNKADDLIQSKYVLADIKLINLLKVIASSETILKIIKNSLDNFDYQREKAKILRPSSFMGEDKGEVFLPEDLKTVIAFVFNLLMEIDNKTIDLSSFIQKYFFESGSYYESYSAFMTKMVLPFKMSIKFIMEGIISGKLETPFEEKKESFETEKETEFSNYKEEIKFLLEKDLIKLEEKRLGKIDKEEVKTVVEAFMASLELDIEGIKYAYYAYKYTSLYYDKLGFNYKKITKILKREELI
ncbi:MAG: hypothetical protein E7342_03120 [Clostridiales bacterium]|nr:hypothetical protein [Clostridiales bacterium]